MNIGHFQHEVRRLLIQGGHVPCRLCHKRLIGQPGLKRRADNAGTQGFGENQLVPYPAASIEQDFIRMHHAGHRKPKFWFVILYTVPSDEKDTGLAHLIKPPLKNLPEYRHIHCLCREADNIHCRKRSSSHCIDVAQGIRNGYLAECVRIIYDRREKIHRLDDSQVVAQFIDSRVLRMLHPDDQIRIGNQR